MSLLPKNKWILATQWDSDALQYVLARTDSTNQVTLVSARSLEHTGEVEYIAELLKSEMDKHNARKPTVLVTLPRSKADVIPMELPPSTDAELTKLVPLQAMQQVGDLGDDSMLDYLPLNAEPTSDASNGAGDTDSDTPSIARRVLAVNPQPAEIERIRETLSAADLASPERITFRPLAPLPLVETIVPNNATANGDTSKKRSLFVTLQQQHADMLLMEGQQLLLNRSIRLTDQTDQVFVETLVDEIRRTDLVAPANPSTTDADAPPSSIAQILAFGGIDEQETWHAVEQLAEVPVQLVNPLEYLPASNDFAVRKSGRFAPLIGTILEHTSNAPTSTIDFLTPRRPVTPPSLFKRFGIYAIAAASLFAIAGYFLYEQRVTAESQITELSDQLALEEKIGAKLKRRQQIAQAVQQWRSDDVNCLDELLDLSNRLPVAKDAFIQRLAIAPVKGGKSVIMQVRVRDQELVKQLESNLRDNHHRVTTKPVSEISADEEFGWQFDATVLVAPRSAEDYRNAFANEPNPTVTDSELKTDQQ